MPLRARPEAEEQLKARAFVQEISIAISREEPRAAAQAKRRVLCQRAGCSRNLERADIRLLVAETLMFSGVLRSQLDRHAGGDRNVDHSLIDAFGVHVDFDFAAASGDGLEQRLPEAIAAFGDPALAMNAHGESLNFRDLFQQDGKRVAAVAGVVFRSEPLNVMVGIGTIGPLVGVSPDAELKMQSASRCLSRNEAQRGEILFPFGGAERYGRGQPSAFRRGKLHHANIGKPGNLDEIRIGKMKIVVRYTARKVVFESIGQGETIKAAGNQRVEISAPESFVVVPGFVFQFGAEVTAYAAHLVRGLFIDGLAQMQSFQWMRAEADALRQFEQSVDEAECVAAGDEDRRRRA